jgi:uncharacterized membrane protein YkoI
MRSYLGGLLTFAVLGLLGLTVAVRAEDEKIPLDKVPKVVLDAVRAKFPKAEIVAAEKGDQDGKIVYEFDLKQGDKKWEAAFTPEGKFVSTEEEVKEADLPAKVSDAFKKKYPGAKVVAIEKETTGEGADAKVVYEIVIEAKKGKLEVQFSPNGKFLGEEAKK